MMRTTSKHEALSKKKFQTGTQTGMARAVGVSGGRGNISALKQRHGRQKIRASGSTSQMAPSLPETQARASGGDLDPQLRRG